MMQCASDIISCHVENKYPHQRLDKCIINTLTILIGVT
jgi:hypothetical protein